jgi:hypothetical protein
MRQRADPKGALARIATSRALHHERFVSLSETNNRNKKHPLFPPFPPCPVEKKLNQQPARPSFQARNNDHLHHGLIAYLWRCRVGRNAAVILCGGGGGNNDNDLLLEKVEFGVQPSASLQLSPSKRPTPFAPPTSSLPNTTWPSPCGIGSESSRLRGRRARAATAGSVSASAADPSMPERSNEFRDAGLQKWC